MDEQGARSLGAVAARDDGLRRLSALTLAVALGSAVATGVVAVAAQHASAASTAKHTDGDRGLQGPDQPPLPGQDGVTDAFSTGS